jgi:predicted ArsR family transcriptional regulator
MCEERDEIESIGESAGRRREVLRLLRASSNPMSILAIADALGVHPNTVRFHLDVLVGDGQVEQVAPSRKGPGRPPLMFQAVRQMDRGGTRHYRLLAEILSTALATERNSTDKALTAGRTWGLRMESPSDGDVDAEEAVDHLVDMLDELGFAPERRAADGDGDGGQQIGLRHCPFLELAENGTAVVCQVHLGLMQGAMETWGAPVTVDRLEAFVDPDLCVAHLGAGGPAKGIAG